MKKAKIAWVVGFKSGYGVMLYYTEKNKISKHLFKFTTSVISYVIISLKNQYGIRFGEQVYECRIFLI